MLNYLYSQFYCNLSIYSQIIYHIVGVALAVALVVYLCLEIIYGEIFHCFTKHQYIFYEEKHFPLP